MLDGLLIFKFVDRDVSDHLFHCAGYRSSRTAWHGLDVACVWSVNSNLKTLDIHVGKNTRHRGAQRQHRDPCFDNPTEESVTPPSPDRPRQASH